MGEKFPAPISIIGKRRKVAIAAPTTAEIKDIASELNQFIELKELGDVKTFIDMQFVRDRATRRICMHQTDYIKRIIAKFVGDLDSMPCEDSVATRHTDTP